MSAWFRRLAGTRVVRRWPRWGPTALALLGLCLSLTPSLLPRTWYAQGLVGGLSAAVAYALGCLLWAAVRLIPLRPRPGFVRVMWTLLLVAGLGAVTASTIAGIHWQNEVRQAVGMDSTISWWPWVLAPVLSVAFCAVLVLIARVARLFTRLLINLIDRMAPRPVAYVTGLALAVVLGTGFVQGYLFNPLLGATERAASLAHHATSPDLAPPTSPLLSGAEESLVRWETLGAKGRDFIGGTPSIDDIAAFTGRPAQQPIRVYIGLDSAATLAERARLAVAELERTGGFGRKVLGIMTTTGSGWVNERAALPLEYMHSGDSALVAIQYSYLPSWISLITEDTAERAGKALFDAIYAKVATLATPPKLLLFGESLGSYAIELGFEGGLSDLTSRTQGALFIGPPHFNPIWYEVIRDRDPGSPMWRPSYQKGRNVRFAQVPDDLVLPGQTWHEPRIAYLQNGSDPVVWWTPELIYREPDWLKHQRAADVSPDLTWYPVVTFWQITTDLLAGQAVPQGHGHDYGTLPVTAWAQIAAPEGWSDADTARLAAHIETLTAVE